MGKEGFKGQAFGELSRKNILFRLTLKPLRCCMGLVLKPKEGPVTAIVPLIIVTHPLPITTRPLTLLLT